MRRTSSVAACALTLLAACSDGSSPRPAGDGAAPDGDGRLDDADTDGFVEDATAAEVDGGGTPLPTVHVWLTTSDLTDHLTLQPGVVTSPAEATDLTFDDSTGLQTIDGFGAAMTDTSASLLENALGPEARAQVMADLFSRTTGIGLSLVRVPMGSSDFSACSCTYSYDDGTTDATLAGFSTAHDDAYILPALAQAQALNAQLKIFANPWSPPGWMKTNGSMLGTTDGGAGTLLPAAYDPLAQYFVRFLQDYAAHGVPVWGVTPQNEPSIAPDSYSGMAWTASEEADFIANHLAPALVAAGLNDVRILGGDDIGASLSFAQTLFANASESLYATTWHCYTGLSDMAAIHAAYPDKPLYMSECSTGPTGIAGDAAQQVLTSLSNWASGAVLWNLALDTSGGPKMGAGCVGCTGLVTVDTTGGDGGAPSYTINYYELAQFSKFVVPGAARVAHAGGDGVSAEAFRNPDGTSAVIAYNPGTTPESFGVSWASAGSFRYTLPPGATVTFTDSDAGM